MRFCYEMGMSWARLSDHYTNVRTAHNGSSRSQGLRVARAGHPFDHSRSTEGQRRV